MIGIKIAGKSSKTILFPFTKDNSGCFLCRGGSRGWVPALHEAGCSRWDRALRAAVAMVHEITTMLQWHQQPEHPREGIDP